jgi:hypothetical protein
MKKLTVLLLLFSVAVFAAAPKKFTNDVLQFGSSATSAVKELIFDVGDGASNPKIGVDTTNKDFDMSANLNVDGDALSVGDGTASNKEMSFDIGAGANNPKLFWDNTAGALSFTNDGTLIKKIGSGSGSGAGGGIQLLSNSSFEDPGTPILNWTNSGGTLTQEDHVNANENNTKFARFVATGSSQYVESDAVTVSDDVGFGCMADAYYNQGDNAFTLKVLKEDLPGNPGTFNEVASGSFSDLTSFLKLPTVTFPCEGGDVFKLRFESTGAGTVDLDLAYLGSNKNISPVKVGVSDSLTVDVGVGYGSSATHIRRFQDMNIRQTNGSYVTSSIVDGTESPGKLLRVNDSAADGTSITVLRDALCNFSYGDQNSSTTDWFGVSINAAALNIGILSLVNEQRSKVFHIGGSGGNDIGSMADSRIVSAGSVLRAHKSGTSANGGNATFTVTCDSAPETQEAFTPEQAEFEVRGRIEGPIFALTSSTESSRQQISNGSLILINDKGSANIACQGAGATGTTCSGSNEVLGFNFTAPVSGEYEVCFTVNHLTQTSATQATTFWIEKRAPDDSVLLDVAAETTMKETTGDGWNYVEPVVLCGRFNVTNVGEQRFELKYTKDSGTASLLMTNTPTRNGQAKFSARLIKNDVATPRLLNQVSTRARYGSEKGVCNIDNPSGTPSFDSNDPDCWFIQSVSGALGSGRPTITTITPGFKCGVSSLAGNIVVTLASGYSAQLPASFEVQTRSNSDASLTNQPFSLSCSKNK